MKKIILILAILLGVGLGSVISTQPAVTKSIIIALQTKPTELNIPAINLKAPVEYVGMDKQGAMDVPKNTDNVGWYKLGPRPGDRGSAVIAGHLDTKTGPAVFANIFVLKPGDEVKVTDENGKVLHFTVEKTATYPEVGFPIAEVFGQADRPRLNLITCKGDFNRQTKEYNQRYVVYSVLK